LKTTYDATKITPDHLIAGVNSGKSYTQFWFVILIISTLENISAQNNNLEVILSLYYQVYENLKNFPNSKNCNVDE